MYEKRKKTILYIRIVFSIVLITFTIISLVWLFKVKNYSKKEEPYHRDKYLIEGDDPLNYYTEGDFCYDHYYSYLIKGAFKDLDIRMKKIHKYSIYLIKLFFIDLILFFLIIPFRFISQNDKIESIKIILSIFSSIISILELIFFIILSKDYYKSNFDDFEDFSECVYFKDSDFNKDYDFVFVVKNNYENFFFLTLITIGLNFIKIILIFILKMK